MAHQEVAIAADELIVTKTDLKGKITYANRTFMRVANYSEQQLLGQAHNIIRHPDMPRGVYFAMWQTLQSKTEFFGLVKNYTADHNYYWVFANVTPDLIDGSIVGYYSVRRKAPKEAVQQIIPLYEQMLEKERSVSNSQAPKTSWGWLEQLILDQHKQSYEEFIVNLYQRYTDGSAL